MYGWLWDWGAQMGGDGMVVEGRVKYGSWEGREQRGCEGMVGRGRD